MRGTNSGNRWPARGRGWRRAWALLSRPHPETLETARASAASFLDRGVDRLCLFNYFDSHGDLFGRPEPAHVCPPPKPAAPAYAWEVERHSVRRGYNTIEICPSVEARIEWVELDLEAL